MAKSSAGSLTLADVITTLENLWPLAGSEVWDAPGLIVGDLASSVTSIHLMVDVTRESVAEALDNGADLIVAHHPLLLRGVTTVAESTYKGHLLATLIRAGCALYAAHTNADVVPTGTSARLAELLELVDHIPITSGGYPWGKGWDVPAPFLGPSRCMNWRWCWARFFLTPLWDPSLPGILKRWLPRCRSAPGREIRCSVIRQSSRAMSISPATFATTWRAKPANRRPCWAGRR